jgi:hypothetical protein
MRLASTVIVLGTVAGTARADVPHTGNALDDLIDPRSVAMGEAGRGTATGESSIGLNPSGAASNHELAVEVDYGYRLSDSASLVTASACDSTNAVPGCFYYHYTGASPDSIPGTHTHSGLHVFGSTLSYPLTPNVAFGTGLKYYHFDSDDLAETGGMPSTTVDSFAFDAGLTAHLGSMLSIGAAGYNLIGPSAEMPRALGGGIYVRPVSMLTLAFDSRWLIFNGDHSARYGGGVNLMLSPSGGQMGVPISGGVLHDDDLGVTYLSGGLGLTTMGFGLDVTARFAVDGPKDTEILASLRLWPVSRSLQ